MKSVFSIAVIALCWSLLSCVTSSEEVETLSQSKLETSNDVEDYKLNSESIYWMLTKGKMKVYVLGTFHMGIAPKDLPVDIWKGFDEAETVVFEAKDFTINQQKLFKRTFWNDFEKLNKVVGAENVKKIFKIIKESDLKIDHSTLKNLSPFGLFSISFMAWEKKFKNTNKDKLNLSVPKLDEFLLQYAQGKSKKVVGLETAERQLDLLETSLDDDYFSAFCQELKHPEKSMTLLDSYKRNDSFETTRGLANYGPLFNQNMIVDRNRNWIFQLNRLFRQNHDSSVFLAVGLGHLGGKQGIIQLLKNTGFSAKPILGKSSAEFAVE